MEEIEGIPIISHPEATSATFLRFGLQYGDPHILDEAIKTIEHACRETAVSALRGSLWEGPEVSSINYGGPPQCTTEDPSI